MVSTESTAPTKKEKRSKKERKATTTTEFTLSINFGLVNTYKGLGVRGIPLPLPTPETWL